MTGHDRLHVVVAGGSIAALETLGGLSRLAGDRVALTLVAPEDTFTYRPLALTPRSQPAAASPPSLGALAAVTGAHHVRDRISWVDPTSRTVHTTTGARLDYDALVVAIGARASAGYEHAVTLKPSAAAAVEGLLADVRAGRARRAAFVVTEREGWLIALYETVLATAHAAEEAGQDCELTVLTPERAPLSVFGHRATRRILDLLEQLGVRVLSDVRVEVPAPGRVSADRPDRSSWEIDGLDRVVATARLRGPYLRGLAIGDGGFIPIDPYCRVPGRHWIFAAGDATTFPVKHGGVAAQQADVVARGIAARAGVPDVRRPFRPRLQARLMTGSGPLYLGADLIGGEPFGSTVTDAPAVAAGPKVIAKELNRLLDAAGGSGRSADPNIKHRV